MPWHDVLTGGDMQIRLHRNFEKQYRQVQHGEQKRRKERFALFLRDEFHPLLNNHPLQGRYHGYRSINVGGDLRAIYRKISSAAAYFAAIGTHGTLYS